MVPVSVYAEMTPNPSVLKFVVNKRIIEQDSVEFKNIEQAKPSPLASKLFHFPFVKEVFISGNYLAVTKYDIVEWEEITMELRELIRDFLAEGNTVIDAEAWKEAVDAASGSTTSGESPSNKVSTPSEVMEQGPHPNEKPQDQWEPIDHKIVELLDEYVRPAVAADGGNIKFLDHQKGIVSVLLQGACSGCPSSTATLKQGIETMLKQMLPGQINLVQAVNG